MLWRNIKRNTYKRALIRVIAPYAFWSYRLPEQSPDVSDDNLIEAVLIHGNDALRYRLFKIFNKNQIRQVWEQKLIIQGTRLKALNLKIATEFIKLKNPEIHIQQAFRKNNLYDRFSA